MADLQPSFTQHARERAVTRFGCDIVLRNAIDALEAGGTTRLTANPRERTERHRFRHSGHLVEFVFCPETKLIVTLFPADESRRARRPLKAGLRFGRGRNGRRTKCKGRSRMLERKA